ncbi:MAG: transposase [Deltaproteobacteria bacterium]|nr:transposase [Deltaproteobacteria bacterium]
MTTRNSKDSRDGRQLGFHWRRHGGARKGAGRPRSSGRRNVVHRTRDRVRPYHGQHVTLRIQRSIGWLRNRRLAAAILRSLRAGAERFGTRIVHFSVQFDHVHLIAEADDNRALTRSIKGLSVRVARALNRVLARKGSVFADRYHTRALTSPRAARHALAYVLCNYRHHTRDRLHPRWVDPLSSAGSFDGWATPPRIATTHSLAEPRCWLLQRGWKKAGLIDSRTIPGPPT